MLKTILITFIPRFFLVILTNASVDHVTVCNELTCEMNEQCVIRKFWCDYNVCPQMIYCSKSQLESLRGPETCKSVFCPDGYKCVLRAHECTWNNDCKQRFARCISNVELADEPVSCLNVKCGKGHQCVLRETHYCPRPPCRLTKSCAYSEDVEIWFDKCRQLGCRSEHDCFLRRPAEKCAMSSCAHIPDCLVTPNTFESTSSKLCYGWICPIDQVCSARLQAPCNTPGNNCPILRSCSRPSSDLTQHPGIRTTLSDIEKDILLGEQRRLQQYREAMNFTEKDIQRYYDGFLSIAGPSWKNPDYAASPMKSGRVSVSPIMRSTSQHGGDSVWLTYLKRRTGAEAVRYWIDKAKSNQDYEGFVEWLNTVEELLDPDTYRLWLMEVESASANVPEFQAWISLRNLAAHRLAAVASPTQRTLPVSIADRAKNLFYSDKSLAFGDHRQKAESGGAIRQPANFKFNEASQLEDGRLAHLEIPFRPQGPSDVAYGLPQNFGGVVKNSWNSWQSYYQLKPPGLSGSAGGHLDTKARQNAGVPQMFFVDDRYATALKHQEVSAARSLGAMIEQIEDFKKIRPNVAKLEPSQSTSQLMLSSSPKDNKPLPNLLIYFPPPLNFFIYYFVGSSNNTENITLQTNDKDNSKSQVGMRMFNSDSYIPEDYDDNPNFYNKTSPVEKQKEFEFIRKIIKELINYWDDEEQSLGKSDKFNNNDTVIRMGNYNGKSQSVTSSVTHGIKFEEAEGKSTFNKFLEWLFENGHINSTQLSNSSSRKTYPLVPEESVHSPNSRNSENNTNTTSGKIRILVDIDKNPEIIKKLFSKDITDKKNDSNSRQYQVIVNLDEYAESQEKDLISQKLINIASTKLHRNITGDEKIPKMLWVFPVYGNEENETILNEFKERNREQINTLVNVDVPTTHTDNNDSYHNLPDNHKTNSSMRNVNQVNNSSNDQSNVDNSTKDAEGEYYDDHDMYDEYDYE
ncbi:uncharacterized protein LOC131675754 [Phymastichus coffea]|uniref:uncharacterized protein LOC131675754 n=1 Tax=Phymastichus coffea TaxID=108790 RepID=UPI00273B8697|nr:uncharacterized protein LOC131675754 [Phymastichus coffea]